MPTEAGVGEHHTYLLKKDGAETVDTAVLEARKHYLGVDAVRWYVNKQGNLLSNRMASGTVKIGVAEESYEVGLGTYQLEGGAYTAPVFDQPVLANRVFTGGRITIKVFARAIEEDSLLGGLLRDMAKASLDVVAGAVGAATATGPMSVLLSAGSSLTGGVKKILEGGKRAITLFDPSGLDVTLDPNQLRGPENYLLVHRGMRLNGPSLRLTGDQNGTFEVLYNDVPLQDGAWVVFRLRREDEYGSARPWEEDARGVRIAIDELIDQWLLGGIQPAEVLTRLTPQGSEPPSLGDQVLSVVTKIRSDYVLAEREAIKKAGQLRSLLVLAQRAARDNDPKEYLDQRQGMEDNIKAGKAPPLQSAEIFASEANHMANMRATDSVIGAPDLVGDTLWRTLRYVKGL